MDVYKTARCFALTFVSLFVLSLFALSQTGSDELAVLSVVSGFVGISASLLAIVARPR